MNEKNKYDEAARDQIEEIAKTLFSARETGDLKYSQLRSIAKDLYNEGYRKQEWISVDERLPKPFVSVLVYMPGETPHPTVREGFINNRGKWYAGGFDRLPDEVVMWKEMPEAPKMKGGAE